MTTTSLPQPSDPSPIPTGELALAPHHAQMLLDSGISDEVALRRGYRTIANAGELYKLGFSWVQCRAPGLLLPLHTTDGQTPLYVYRPDNARVHEERSKHNPDGTHPCREIKYELPRGAGVRLDCPPTCRPGLADPRQTLWVTEGQKKADALASRRQVAIALLGVWAFSGRNEFGGITFLADWNYVALKDRQVYIVFDSDVMRKPNVAKALERLRELLQRRGAHVAALYLPNAPDGRKLGVDDWLRGADGRPHKIEELEALAEAPRPLPQAAPARVELLDAAPLEMRRPLCLVDGRAYAAAWLPVRVTRTEKPLKSGEIVRLEQPEVRNEIHTFIVRDDGLVFGEGADRPPAELGFEVIMQEVPPLDRRWTRAGVEAFRSGRRPHPAEVFQRIAGVIDRFIDFDRSLAPQRTMAEMVACYILHTWLLDAFNVTGFLWPNGEKGSGKTNLLLLVARMAYLGTVVLAGGSYASLRDLADFGATLAFDDAENLAGERGGDPDKRALLLAGNRRGVNVTVKELTADKTWRNRQVNAFCPRLFSAIRMPDATLASRTIVVPLVRTSDRARANSDPYDDATWPCSLQALVDDLWALGLGNLSHLKAWDEWVGEHAGLAGRNLQPWRALLAVAAWLDDCGVTGLWERMDQLSQAYQSERQTLEAGDFTAMLIKTLVVCARNEHTQRQADCANRANRANRADLFETPVVWNFTTEFITEVAKALGRETESDVDPDRLTTRRVGQALRKMRLNKVVRSGGIGPRGWRLTRAELRNWLVAYSMPVPDWLAEHQPASQAEMAMAGDD